MQDLHLTTSVHHLSEGKSGNGYVSGKIEVAPGAPFALEAGKKQVIKIDPTKAGKFVHHVLPGIVRPLRVLWNEVIGFLFVVLAVIIIASTIRRTANDPDGFGVLVAGVAFGLVLGFFGVQSFWRARKISRS